jgi:hypothetical protein
MTCTRIFICFTLLPVFCRVNASWAANFILILEAISKYLQLIVLIFRRLGGGGEYVNMERRKNFLFLWILKHLLIKAYGRVEVEAYFHVFSCWALFVCVVTVVRSIPRPFYRRGKGRRCTLGRKLRRPNSRRGRFEEEKNTLMLLATERTLFCPASSSLVGRISRIIYK